MTGRAFETPTLALARLQPQSTALVGFGTDARAGGPAGRAGGPAGRAGVMAARGGTGAVAA